MFLGLFALNRRHSRTKSTCLKMCAGKKRYFHQLFHVGSLLGPSVGALLTLWGSLWALLGVPGLSSDSGGLSVGVLSGRLFLCAGAVVRALGSLVGSL